MMRNLRQARGVLVAAAIVLTSVTAVAIATSQAVAANADDAAGPFAGTLRRHTAGIVPKGARPARGDDSSTSRRIVGEDNGSRCAGSWCGLQFVLMLGVGF